MEREMKVKMVGLDNIRPNPFQPRESFPKDEIQELADSIKEIGLLQPIAVRPKGATYQIIHGERRWRAGQFAGLKEIPAIIKDIDDSQLMLESLIENVHRKDLKPIERGRGLAEVYRLSGFEPEKASKALVTLKDIMDGFTKRKPNEEEQKIKRIADMVGLSYDYQYRLLSQLRLSPQEQDRVAELGLGYEEISSIATVKKPEIRTKMIEIAPELKRAEVKKMSKIVKKAPEPVVKATLEREITPDVAEIITKELSEEKQIEAIREVKRLRLDEKETRNLVKQLKIEVPVVAPTPEKWEEIREKYESLQEEISERLKDPEVKARGKLFRNWVAHTTIRGALDSTFCPICGADWKNLVWKCHGLTVKEALEKAKESYQESIRGSK